MIRSFPPDPSLATCIESYWTLAGNLGVPGVSLLPHYYVELIINFGTPHRVASARNQTLRHSWLNGQKIVPARIMDITTVRFFAVRFRPGGARVFFPLPQSEFVDAIIDADLLLGSTAVDLRDSLGEAPSDERRAALLDAFFLRRLRATPNAGDRGAQLVHDGIRHIQAHGGRISVKRLAERSGLSYRQFLRHFQDRVGLSPHTLCRLEAFQRAALRLTYKGRPPLAEVAAECEYFDQAHMTRDFQEFSGLTPLRFLERVRRTSPMPPGLLPLLVPEL